MDSSWLQAPGTSGALGERSKWVKMTPERVAALASILSGYEMECAGTDEQLAQIAIVRTLLAELGSEET